MERGSSKHGPKRDDELAHEMQGTLKGNRSRGGPARTPAPTPPPTRPNRQERAPGGVTADA
ncbi:hypothetical protein, partial [Nocardia cyriacigeorgica]|uniref:hypothetical protein n=1 Tax=Nocardia cyriacigeorgica TaxID=135487 RepID=UPI002458D200